MYSMPLNVIAFLAAFWTAVIHVAITREWLAGALWLTLGFAALTSERLTPVRLDPPDEA
jgi:hypothetical protein